MLFKNHFSKNEPNGVNGFINAFQNQIEQYFKKNEKSVDKNLMNEEIKKEFSVVVLDEII